MTFLISAGEASSDLYGAQLSVALRRRARADDEPLQFMGVGGDRMRAAGCETLVDAKHLAVVGMTEIISHLPKIYREFRKLVDAVDSLPKKPDAAIVIDSPAFNFRVAREMQRRGIPVIYFVAPQLWAWREYRIKRIQKWVKKVLCIFPFEEEFYRKHGVDVEYVGHPLADLPEPEISREEYAKQNCLNSSQTWIAMLPGSRRKELRANLRTMVKAAATLQSESKRDLQFLLPLAPNLDIGWFRHEMAKAESSGVNPDMMLTEMRPVHDARAALFHSRAAVVASGTATVEAALMQTPFVTVYRLSPLTFMAARRLVKVPYAAMPNLIAGRQIVPELLQDDFTPQNVATRLREIITEGEPREKMLAGLAEVCQKLRFSSLGHGSTGIERAADAIFRTIPGSGER